jgi:hypothetical protein
MPHQRATSVLLFVLLGLGAPSVASSESFTRACKRDLKLCRAEGVQCIESCAAAETCVRSCVAQTNRCVLQITSCPEDAVDSISNSIECLLKGKTQEERGRCPPVWPSGV